MSDESGDLKTPTNGTFSQYSFLAVVHTLVVFLFLGSGRYYFIQCCSEVFSLSWACRRGRLEHETPLHFLQCVLFVRTAGHSHACGRRL